MNGKIKNIMGLLEPYRLTKEDADLLRCYLDSSIPSEKTEPTVNNVVKSILDWAVDAKEEIQVRFSPRSESVYLFLMSYELQHEIRVSNHQIESCTASISIICGEELTITDKINFNEITSYLKEEYKINDAKENNIQTRR